MHRLLRALLATLLLSTPLCAQQILVAAAADLSAALNEIAANYFAQSGVMVKLSFGASGNLFNQIQNGAPFDLYFSADEEYPKQLIENGLADKTSLYRYATGKLVLWVPTNSNLNIDAKGLEVLLDPSVKKIAIANPQHAPYGRAAAAALRHAKLYDQVADKLVLGENVSQAAQFVESGNAQAGLVALSHALNPAMKNKGRYWQVPSDYYPPLNQAAVLLSRSQQKEQALKFLEYLRSPDATNVLRRFGFTVGTEGP